MCVCVCTSDDDDNILEQKEDIESNSKPSPNKTSLSKSSHVSHTHDNNLTYEKIKQICKRRDDLYDTPELNETFFLHYQNFTKIQVHTNTSKQRMTHEKMKTF